MLTKSTLVILSFFFISACNCNNENIFSNTVSLSVGKIISLSDAYHRYEYSDTNPFGEAQAFILFEEEYKKNIKSIPVEYRVKFFWSILWHLDLQGDHLTEFLKIIEEDCYKHFTDKLTFYIEREEKITRNKYRLKLSKGVLTSLERIHSFKTES